MATNETKPLIIIEKDHMPAGPYSRGIIKGEVVMFTVMQDGIVAYFPALDQVRLAGFDSLLEFMAGAPAKEEEKPEKPNVRPVRKPE